MSLASYRDSKVSDFKDEHYIHTIKNEVSLLSTEIKILKQEKIKFLKKIVEY